MEIEYDEDTDDMDIKALVEAGEAVAEQLSKP